MYKILLIFIPVFLVASFKKRAWLIIKFQSLTCSTSKALKKSVHVFYRKLICFHKKTNNEEGLAVIETVPLLTIFIILITYALGYWGAIHSGVLSAMAARNYSFETFRNRSHLTVFRENRKSFSYSEIGWQVRIHRVVSYGGYTYGTVASKRPISFKGYSTNTGDINNSTDFHNELTSTSHEGRGPSSLGYSNQDAKGDNEIWLQIGYGYCLNLKCGD